MTGLRAGQATDVGLVRANNQDQFLVATPLFAVADGMGGHAAGEVASAVACVALGAAWEASEKTPEALVAAAEDANRAVFERAQSDSSMHGMGTTLVAVALTGSGIDERVAIAHVGDSRVYRLHEGELQQVTADHSLVAELVAEGQIRAEEAERHPQRHVLSRALGVYPDVEVDLTTESAEVGDRFLLCSDGLSREVSDDQIASVLRRLADPEEAARELVDVAKAHGGADNITVVVVDLTAAPDSAISEAAAGAPEAGGAPGEGAGEVVALGDDPPPRDDTSVLPAVTAAPATEQKPKRQRVVTVRFVAFILALVAVVVIAIGGIDLYARSSWYVGLQGDQLVIFQGRPGGVLWFHPSAKVKTGVTTSQVEARHLGELRAGKVESSESAARQYVTSLTNEEQSAQGQATTPSTTLPPISKTTVPSTTVPPSTTTATTAPPG